MTPQINISQPLFSKLQEMAEPFVDTPETVISRAVEFYLSKHETGYKPSGLSHNAADDAGVMVFQAEAPPDLSFTRPVSIVLEGEKFDKPMLYWNPLMFELVKQAAIRLKDTDKLKKMLLCNYADGERTKKEGYVFIPEAKLSVQGQAANPCWKTIAHIVKQLNLKLDVTFVWDDKPKSAHPGKTARMSF